ncbi:MAG: hypothetical protein HYX65_11775 [Gemmatimonadetes bacterium]|nr:hypothetical protein [Gemmatimonadota bacterium]
MPDSYFPRQAINWAHLDEPPVVRRLSIGWWGLPLAAGTVVRLLRAVVFSAGSTSVLTPIVYGALVVFITCGALTAHVGNFTVRQWTWRVPIFAALEALAESVVSLGLIVAGVEQLGSEQATVGQWPTIVVTILRDRLILLAVYATALAVVVEFVRYAFFKRADRVAMDTEAVEEVAQVTGEHGPI